MNKKLGLMLGLLLYGPLGFANDSSVGLDAGNIYFKQSDGIAMRSEELYISPKTVRVKYEFQNETGKDIKTLVGFPIAPFTDYDGDKSFDSTSNNPLGFATWVDGKKIPVKMVRKEKDGQLEYTYVWEQVFPVGKTLLVEHHYDTHPGGSVSFSLDAEYVKRYCIESDAAARLNKIKGPLPYEVNYILHTGANWKGPIGKFRLVVDKLRKDAVISFCGHGVRKIGATQFEMLKTDFKPQQDLAILFVKPAESDEW